MPQIQTIKPDGTKLVKKFKCSFCDRYFTRSEHRSRHELSHSNERPYRCTQCVSSFVRRDLLLRHCRTVHQGNIMPAPKKIKTERKELGATNGSPPAPPSTGMVPVNGNNAINGYMGGIPRRPSAADSLLSLANGSQQEISTAMLMTEMQAHSPQQQMGGIQTQIPMLTEQRGLQALGGQSVDNPTEPLSPDDLREISALYSPNTNFELPQFHKITNDIDNPAQIPQFGPDFNSKAFLETVKQRPSIRTEFTSAKDISRLQMDRYLSAFFCFFHPIMPMFHTQTFDTHTASPYLLYSILAMGAVLCHESTAAQIFSYNSRIVFSPDIYNSQDKLQLAQTLILIVIYASYTGDMAGAETAAARSMMLRIVEQVLEERDLKSPGQKSKQLSWHDWIHEQVAIRTYWCSLIAVTTMACIFNASGVVSLETISYNILLPCSEVIWNNQFNGEHEWRSRWHEELQEIPQITIGDLLNIVERSTENINNPPVLNPFSVRVLGNVLFLRASGVGPGTDPQRIKELTMQMSLWEAVAKDPYPGLGQGPMLAIVNTPLISIIRPLVYQGNETTLNMPQSVLMAMQGRQHPILIVSYTLLGVARLQLILDLGLVRESLNYRSAERVAEAALTCLTSLQGNGDELIEKMTRVVVVSCDVLRASCLLGHRMYQSYLQSPLTGSIPGQCMILAYELMLGIIIWCYRVEERIREATANPQIKPLDDKLYKVYHWINDICREAGIHQVYGTLAPALAESIAELYDAITTWRLAETMAMSLRLFARGLLNSQNEIMQTTRYQGYYQG